jgi:glycosyltransferase involved in cell wall biosynthesis
LGVDVSVVICAYSLDRWSDLQAAVQSVGAQVPSPREVVVVIDHNLDLLVRARQELAGVTSVESTGERGLSGARNTGLKAASGRIVAFLDDDALAEPGWLSALMSPYEDPRVVATGGLIIPSWDVRRPRWMPEEFDWVVGCSYRGLPTRKAPVRNPIGCNMSVRRDLALSAGGFRSDLGRIGALPAGAEETELSLRLRREDPSSVIIHVPEARVRHRVSARRATWSYFRSRCFHEGRSKAVLARVAGSETALATERGYTLRVLPRAVLGGLVAPLRGDWAGPSRAGAIVAGLAFASCGYVSGRFAGRRRLRLPGHGPR